MKRDAFTTPLPFAQELIIDNFAGGGGTSTGLEAAFGRPVDIAINHDPEALAMHARNHPHTLHLCESVWTVRPIEVTRNQPVALVWLSPDCKHFSKAKGGTPVSRDIRGLAWVGVRWALQCHPRVLMLENVEEFKTWGPVLKLADGTCKPDPARAGETFRAFCGMLSTGIAQDHPALAEACHFLDIDPAGPEAQRLVRGLGYHIDHRELRACDLGTPTIRKRLFFVARRDGLPIQWPEATHAEPTSRAALAGKLAPYRTAAECIDWSIQGTSIFARRKPLATNTQRRIAKGLLRHVLGSAAPFIVTNTTGHPGASADQPLSTVTTGNHHFLGQPTLAPFLTEHANASNQRTMAADEPLRTLCAQVKGGHFSVVAPTITPLRGTTDAHLGGHSAQAPLSTIAASGTHHALTAAHLVTIGYGERPGQDARTQPIAKPLGTAVAGGIKQGVVAATLVDMGHGEGACGTKRFSHGVRDLRVPLGTVTASNPPSALISAFLEQANGGFYDGDGRAVGTPASTITSSGAQQRLVTAYAIKYYSSGGQWQALGEPMHTLPTKARMGLVQAVQVPADSIAPEHRERARQCAELLHTHLPEQFTSAADLVLWQHAGQLWVLVDITLRMLKPRELYRAQGFPEGYVIDQIPDPAQLFGPDGRQAAQHPLDLPQIPLSTTAQVRMCGNSVCPPVAEALVRANFGHELLMYGRAVA